MRHVWAWLLRMAALIRPGRSDEDIQAELESHLELHVADNIRSGMNPEAARRQAWIALGGLERTKDEYRDQRGIPIVESVLRDVRHGVRVLLDSPGFSVSAVAILGLGIGANAAIFSIVNGVVLRPLGYPDSSRIVRVWHTPPREQFAGTATFWVSPANYIDWRADSTAFEHMAAYEVRRANLTGGGEPDALAAAIVSGDFFPALRAPAKLGRLLDIGDEDPGRSHVAVLSERVWKSRFGADASVIGRSITINGEPYTVAGVIADNLAFPFGAELWLPLVWTPEERAVRGIHNYRVIARLKDGLDLPRAQAEMSTISQRLEHVYPADDKGWGALVVPLHQDLIADVRWGLFVLLGAVGCVLLIACANLANLLLVRMLGRSREIAIRAAIGATRGRVIQQVLVESALLGVAGGIVGLFAAVWSLDLIVKSFGATLPRADQVGVDARVLGFTCTIAIVTGLIAGVAPAWRLTRGDAGEALKRGLGRGGSQAGERRVRNVLVTAEVALALILLVGAGLLMRTLWQLYGVHPGIDPRQVVTMSITVPETRYGRREQRLHLFGESLRRVRALPGVEAAATIDSLPLSGSGSTEPVAVQGNPTRPISEQPEVAVRTISPGYVSSVRMQVTDGRDFSDDDVAERPPTAVVSESVARRFWPDERAVGKHLTLGLISNRPREVVGVVSDVKVHGLNSSDGQTVYVPFAQNPGLRQSIVVRAASDPRGVVPSVVAAVHAVDPEQPVVDVRTMDEVIDESIAQQRFAMRMLTVFAALALLLAAVGIYAVVSYTVRERVQEIGIRMALGAPTRDVMRMVVLEGLKPILAGLLVGVVGSAAVGRAFSSLVFGVTPHDAATFAIMSGVVLAIGCLSSLVPAFRATRVDAIRALRGE